MAHTWPDDCRWCMDKLAGKTEGNGMTHKGHHKRCPEKPKPGEKYASTKLAPHEMLRGVRNFSKEHFTKFFLPQQRGINEALDLSIEEHMSEIEVLGNGNSISDAESQKKPPATATATVVREGLQEGGQGQGEWAKGWAGARVAVGGTGTASTTAISTTTISVTAISAMATGEAIEVPEKWVAAALKGRTNVANRRWSSG
eukprot:scaffold914_cov218-Amphora_coffeaeformis.AAC.6